MTVDKVSNLRVIILIKRFEYQDGTLKEYTHRINVPLVKFSPTRYQSLLQNLHRENPFEDHPTQVHTTILDETTLEETPYNPITQSS